MEIRHNRKPIRTITASRFIMDLHMNTDSFEQIRKTRNNYIYSFSITFVKGAAPWIGLPITNQNT